MLQIATGLATDDLNQALRTLERHDILMKQNDHSRFIMELMRRWVKVNSNL